MRKILYSILLFVGITDTYGQVNKGTLIPAKIYQRSLMVGGSISGSYKSLDNNLGTETIPGNRTQVEGDVRIGYFALDDFALGGRVTANHYRQKTGTDQSAVRNTYILMGPFVRYYINSGFFGEASYSLGVNNSSSGSKSDLSEARGGIGYAIFINPKVAVEPAVHLTYLKEKRLDNSTANKYISEFGPSLTIGLQIYLYREKKLTLGQNR